MRQMNNLTTTKGNIMKTIYMAGNGNPPPPAKPKRTGTKPVKK